MGLLALLMVVMATPAMATSNTYVDDGYPPVAYQGDTLGANVTFVTGDKLDLFCGLTPIKGLVLEGCQLDAPTKHVVMPNPCGDEYLGQSFARIMCHELGHLHGWPANHPRP